MPLAELYSANSVRCAAFITAYNPYSKQLTDKENIVRNEQLFSDLQLQGIEVVFSEGQDPLEQWPGEPSFLALGLEQGIAEQLGAKYEQNAIVWCGAQLDSFEMKSKLDNYKRALCLPQ